MKPHKPKRIIIRLDDDIYGESGTEAWMKYLRGHATTAPSHGAKDFGEFWKEGGDIRGWIDEIIA